MSAYAQLVLRERHDAAAALTNTTAYKAQRSVDTSETPSLSSFDNRPRWLDLRVLRLLQAFLRHLPHWLVVRLL